MKGESASIIIDEAAWILADLPVGKAIDDSMFSEEIRNEVSGLCNVCGHDNSLVLKKKCSHWKPYLEDWE